MTRGFTLIELLVVITIIVVLLALLMPAMDKAIYQAELAVCGTNVRSIAVGATQYAMEHHRAYPYRPGIHGGNWQPQELNRAGHPTETHQSDDRAMLRPYMSLNGHLNCPLTKRIDIELSKDTSWLQAPYAFWFGYKWNGAGGGAGMDRIGSRMEFDDGADKHRFTVLASDHDLILKAQGWGTGTHPDVTEARWHNVALQDESLVGVPAIGAPRVQEATLSRWTGPPHNRGPVDMNFAFQDGSVERLDKVRWDETENQPTGRAVKVPFRSDLGSPSIVNWWVHLPPK